MVGVFHIFSCACVSASLLTNVVSLKQEGKSQTFLGDKPKDPIPGVPDIPETSQWLCRTSLLNEACGEREHPLVEERRMHCPGNTCCHKTRIVGEYIGNVCTEGKPCNNFNNYLEQYSMNSCTIENQCEDKCEEPAVCKLISGNYGGVICDCPDPHIGSGNRCKRKPCVYNPCVNGTCVEDDDEKHGYRCNCNKGYTQVVDAKENYTCVDLCSANICGERGVDKCIHGEEKYMCICRQGYRNLVKNPTERCEEADPCDISPCGTPEKVESCRRLSSEEYSCNCKSGYREKTVDDRNGCVKN